MHNPAHAEAYMLDRSAMHLINHQAGKYVLLFIRTSFSAPRLSASDDDKVQGAAFGGSSCCSGCWFKRRALWKASRLTNLARDILLRIFPMIDRQPSPRRITIRGRTLQRGSRLQIA